MAAPFILDEIETTEIELETLEAEVTSIEHQLALHHSQVANGEKELDTEWIRRAEYARDCRRDKVAALTRRIDLLKMKLQYS